ncbi:MAG: hypothetical protein IT440_13950 [Phycisphaeraceae bacterium]|nr:hypothetical protein [Phycisphaeraceae bacterium]
MPDELTVTKRIHFSMANRGRRQIKSGPAPVVDVPDGRIPRIARLMALAIKFDQMIASGAVRDQAELAELGHVTRARVTQIMNLLHLASDIQDTILHLPRTGQGHDPIRERHLRPICAEPNWAIQRRMWNQLQQGLPF